MVPIEFFATIRFDIDNEMEEEQSSWSPDDSDSFFSYILGYLKSRCSMWSDSAAIKIQMLLDKFESILQN